MTVVVLFALTGYQVTGETAAPRLLGRLSAVMIELERWLPAHHHDLQVLANDKPQATLRIEELPIEVGLPAGLVMNADYGELEQLLVAGMADSLYRNGDGAFRTESGSLSVTEPVRWTVTLLD